MGPVISCSFSDLWSEAYCHSKNIFYCLCWDINVDLSVTVGDCPTPVASPSGTILDCYTVDAEHQACWASCPAGKAFLRQVPKLYTCGPSGVWDTSNPFAAFTMPHCGGKNYDTKTIFIWQQCSPSLVDGGLSVGYETWPPIGAIARLIGYSKNIDPRCALDSGQVAMHCGLTCQWKFTSLPKGRGT